MADSPKDDVLDPMPEDLDVQEEMPDPADDAEKVDAQDDNELARLQNENRQLYEKLARVQADYQNAQRRLEKEMSQRLTIAAGQLLRSFLPVLDNLRRATEVPADGPAGPVIDGVKGTLTQWLEVLTQNGVTPIEPKPGDSFEPGHHEALMHQPLPEGAERQTDGQVVSNLLQAGYEFEGRVLRPAQVAVAS